MKKFIISIEETVVETFEIEAYNAAAVEIAIEKYYEGEIVLWPGEVQHKQMSVINSENKMSDWIEF